MIAYLSSLCGVWAYTLDPNHIVQRQVDHVAVEFEDLLAHCSAKWVRPSLRNGRLDLTTAESRLAFRHRSVISVHLSARSR